MQEVLKYQVKISFKVDGVVEKPDIVGAIFGQTEGLFGPELNLNELQKTFKIGRIEIVTKSEKGKTTGTVNIEFGWFLYKFLFINSLTFLRLFTRLLYSSSVKSPYSSSVRQSELPSIFWWVDDALLYAYSNERNMKMII